MDILLVSQQCNHSQCPILISKGYHPLSFFDYIVNIEFVLVYYGLYRQSYPFTCTCTNISTRGWYKSWRSSTWQIIFGNPYHRCAIENQGFCPQTAQYPATAFGSGTVCTYIIGWDHRQFIIL